MCRLTRIQLQHFHVSHSSHVEYAAVQTVTYLCCLENVLLKLFVRLSLTPRPLM